MPHFSLARDTDLPKCPACGKECEIVYKDSGKIVGCDSCLEKYNAYYEPECYQEHEKESG